jgi:osmoprotectant transport system substrate-binding protein
MMRPRIALLLACALIAGACTRASAPAPAAVLADDAITVGSFDFPESELLAEIYAQALTRAGFKVDRSFDVGPRELVMPALQEGLLELIPEYEGSALAFIGGVPTSGERATKRALRSALAPRRLQIAAVAPAEDQNTFAVTAATARKFDLRSLSDLATTGGVLRLGGPEECPDRTLCMKGLEDVYGVRFASFVPLDAGGPLTVQALRQGFVDVGLLFTTSAALVGGDLVHLSDDRRLQPAENVVAVAHAEVLTRFGSGVTRALEAVSSPLTTEALRGLNAQVQGGRSIPDVAAAWVASHPAPP